MTQILSSERGGVWNYELIKKKISEKRKTSICLSKKKKREAGAQGVTETEAQRRLRNEGQERKWK